LARVPDILTSDGKMMMYAELAGDSKSQRIKNLWDNKIEWTLDGLVI
jgi:hypothetical protein